MEWADEIERWLEFVHHAGVLPRFLPVLRGPRTKCESALAEIAVGYFIEKQCGISIAEWEPVGTNGKRGEFLVDVAPAGRMFIEVKSPGWEDEIAKEEGQDSPRLSGPKHINAEARSTAPWTSVRHAVAKAYPKMPDYLPTILIINDDLMVSLNSWPLSVDIALYCPRAGGFTTGYLVEDGCFVGSNYERLGAVGIFQVDFPDRNPRYRFEIFENPNALQAVELPQALFPGYARHRRALVP